MKNKIKIIGVFSAVLLAVCSLYVSSSNTPNGYSSLSQLLFINSAHAECDEGTRTISNAIEDTDANDCCICWSDPDPYSSSTCSCG